jgi:transposase
VARRARRLRAAEDPLHFIRWSRIGVFDRIFANLAAASEATDTVMIDATHLKAHRTAASLFKKGLFPGVSAAPRAA